MVVSQLQYYIHLEKNSGFAGVHPRKGYFNLEFRTDYKIDDPRIVKQQQLSARRYEHTVKLERESDVDEQLLKWLKDAATYYKQSNVEMVLRSPADDQQADNNVVVNFNYMQQKYNLAPPPSLPIASAASH